MLNQFNQGQSYKDFYTLGQIYKCVLKHEYIELTNWFAQYNVDDTIIFIQMFNILHFP